MKQSVGDILRYAYPEIFISDSCTNSIRIQPGWLELINKLCWNLREYISKNPELKSFKIISIEQEFGELKINSNGADQTILNLIQQTINRATTICEFDGEQATGLYVCAPSWFRYLCKSCAAMHDCMEASHFKQRDSSCDYQII